jgi:radical SAM-linked protein
VPAGAQQRLRIAFAKGDAIKYSSHLDLMRAWERTLRRARLPLAYSRGFNPRARLQLAAALPLGHTGGGEILDVWLEERVGVAEVAGALGLVLPPGLTVHSVEEVDLRAQALQAQILSAEYRVVVEWEEPAAVVERRIERVLQAAALDHERRGKRYDLRPLIEALWLERVVGREAVLGMRLAARPGATGRPGAVLDALGMGETYARYHRSRLIW